jgi:hypothetical protein
VGALRILAGTDRGLYELNGESRPRIEGHKVTAIITVGPRWWAVIDDRQIWHGSAEAQVRLASLERRRANCLLHVDSGLLVGTSGAHLLRLKETALEPVAGFDRAEGRRDWYTPWGGPPDTRSLSRAGATVYANVHVGGVLRSEDGERWMPTMDIDADVHQVVAHPAHPGVVFAASARGLGISRDGGTRWDFETAGLHGEYCRAVAVADGTVLVTASTGHASRRGALYRRRDDADAPLEKCGGGLPAWFPANLDTHCLAARGRVVAFGTESGSVFHSSDLGEHWTTVARDLPPVRSIALLDEEAAA